MGKRLPERSISPSPVDVPAFRRGSDSLTDVDRKPPRRREKKAWKLISTFSFLSLPSYDCVCARIPIRVFSSPEKQTLKAHGKETKGHTQRGNHSLSTVLSCSFYPHFSIRSIRYFNILSPAHTLVIRVKLNSANEIYSFFIGRVCAVCMYTLFGLIIFINFFQL